MHDGRTIERLRPAKNPVNADLPYHFLHETEPDVNGVLQKVNTVFLTGKECAFKCLMCDLWKNTLDSPTPPGAILKQLDHALARLPEAEVIKLYNGSNFFDPKAVPPGDYNEIARRLSGYQRVIVENHPKLCGPACTEFNQLLNGQLEIAMGLETINPEALARLNKQMTTADFAHSATYLRGNNIDVRAFILLNPPYITDENENIEWVMRSVKFAFENGVKCCSIIPTRGGNGIMEILLNEGKYVQPALGTLEIVFERALLLRQGRVFADTWDIAFPSGCPKCFGERKKRLNAMNLSQTVLPKINCDCKPVYDNA